MTEHSVITRRRRRPKARPAEILTAALELFTERGFTATRMEDIAAHAGLSKAAIYLYFNDKNSLLEVLVQEMAGTNIAFVSDLVARHQGPVTPVIGQIIEILAERMVSTKLPDMMKLVISESRAHPEFGRFYLENVIGKAFPIMQSLIERGIAEGEFRAVDLRLAVKCMVGPMFLGAMWKAVFEPIGAEPTDIRALARQQADIFVRGLKP